MGLLTLSRFQGCQTNGEVPLTRSEPRAEVDLVGLPVLRKSDTFERPKQSLMGTQKVLMGTGWFSTKVLWVLEAMEAGTTENDHGVEVRKDEIDTESARLQMLIGDAAMQVEITIESVVTMADDNCLLDRT